MKKILSAVLVLFLLLSAAAAPAFAAETAQMKVDSAYYTSGTLYAYVEPVAGNDPTTLTVKPRTESTGLNHDSPKPITDTDTTIDYLLLIDASGSIQSYLPSVFDFVSSLMQKEALPTTIAVASFGQSFKLVADGLKTASEVSDAVENQISYTEEYTDICGSVISAIEHIHTKNRTASEVINLVVITDGKTDLGDTSGSALSTTADRAESIITTSPEIILHSICFGGDWEENTYRAISKGSGIHKTIDGDSSAAEDAGIDMAKMIDSLYTFSLDFNWEDEYDQVRENVDLRVQVTDSPSSSLELFTVENVANLEHIADADGTDENNAPIFEITTDTPAENTTENPEDGAVSSDETQAGSDVIVTDQPDSIFTSSWFIWLIVAVGAVLVIGATVTVILIVVFKKKRAQNQTDAPSAQKKHPDGPAIVMKIQMIQGTSPSSSKEIRLVDEIIIGSAPDCDIILRDPGVEAHNTRIYVENGVIYIENLSEKQNTYLEGMKLFSRNRLRSKDEITVSDTTFKLLF